ncbi:MAG TPA: HEAT repeat domain-containing protein [Smithellaceae bacterium]|nr:HEAT repeat domain-containing protein [Smithellaceae bacterium]HRS89351.1 HEAT repeat domain-containing protein [Smithellaceae bacterium]HRV26556.1 HEAT repeat domain-containing protein [Smithellaceae bacterium]
MVKDIKQEESFPPEVLETLRNMVLAIRAVKLYPANNPAYATAVKKSFAALNKFLQSHDEYRLEIHKNYFIYENMPFKKDAEFNLPIVQDLFVKGIREMIFLPGLSEEELLEFYQALALTIEEQEMKNGIASILWEKSVAHIRITETGLDEVIKTQTPRRWGEQSPGGADAASKTSDAETEKRQAGVPHRTLVLFDLIDDPLRFGENIVELAKQTLTEGESLEDRLFALYKEAGRKIDREQPEQRETLYEGLAKSVLSLDPAYRNGFIADKLYGDLDVDLSKEQPLSEENLPGPLHEIQSGRFSDAWTIQQIAALLKKAAAKPPEPVKPTGQLAYLEAKPVDSDIISIAAEITQYSSEEMNELRAITEANLEWDTVRAATRTLISLIPHIKNPAHIGQGEKTSTVFAGVITQMENMLDFLLKKKDYPYATLIVHALQMPTETEYRAKVSEALSKASARTVLMDAIRELRSHVMDSPEYRAIFQYLSMFERETTEVLLKLLAEEKERKARIFYLDLAKEISKNQTALLGRYLSDDRWYLVRNIVNIMAESKEDQAMAYFRKAADHKNVRIRQEIIHSLQSIGGKKAVSFLARFLSDEEEEVQKTALQAFARFPGISEDEAVFLINFLNSRPLSKKEQNLTLMAIGVLGNIGGRQARDYLKKYTKVRWWRPRKLQEELKTAAQRAIKEISWRMGDGG